MAKITSPHFCITVLLLIYNRLTKQKKPEVTDFNLKYNTLILYKKKEDIIKSGAGKGYNHITMS